MKDYQLIETITDKQFTIQRDSKDAAEVNTNPSTGQEKKN